MQEAEKYYLLALATEKGETNVLNNLAFLYQNQENLQKAEKYYLLAIEKGSTGAMNNLANLYRNQKKKKIILAQKGEKSMKNQGKQRRKVLFRIEKGKLMQNNWLICTQSGKTQEAEKYYLLAIEKGNINALSNLALFYYEEKIEKTKALRYKEFQQHQKEKTRKVGGFSHLE